MWLFKKIKREGSKNSISDKAAQTLASLCSRMQRRFASCMSKTVSNMNTKRLKTTVILFAIVFGGISFCILVNAVTRREEVRLHVDQVNIPQHFSKAGDEETTGTDYVDEETARNIIAFRQYMDSLKKFKRPQYDSIITTRPHLMDSVAMLEQVYNLQKQNSEYEK